MKMKLLKNYQELLMGVIFFTLLFLASSIFSQTYLPPLNWTSSAVKDPQQSAGFLDVADLDGDGNKEIVLSTLMEEGNASSPWSAKGAIRIFSLPNSGMEYSWDETIILPTSENLPFINDPQIVDVDEDGFLDIIVNQGFIQTNGGSQQWIKGPDFTQRFNFTNETTSGNTYYFWHEVVQFDLDGDGKKDIITTSAQTQDAANTNNGSIDPKNAKIEWYRHLGGGNFEYHLINDSLGGVFLKLHDIDNDGDQDIVVSQFFWGVNRPALVWLENVNAPSTTNNYEGEWSYHVIDNTTGLGYYMQFYDIDIDGKDELVYVNHNNEDYADVDYGSGVVMPGLFYFEIPSNPASSSQWTKKTIYDGFRTTLFDFGNPASQGCPGIFSIGDVDGNGYPDIAVPGDGNDTLYLFRQIPGNIFVKEVLDNGKMFGMTKITDLNGDGVNEVIAAKHNFPDVFQILNPPAGFLKIYQPTLNCTQTSSMITPQNPAFCPNDSVLLSSEDNLYYVWNTLDTSKSIYASEIGEYIVYSTNNDGCPSSDTVTVSENIVNVPVINENNGVLTSSEAGTSYQWFIDGNPIPSSDMQSINITQDGDYTVMVTYSNGCSEISSPYNVSLTGVLDYISEGFNIYPNPASNQIKIVGNNINLKELIIYNYSGQQVLEFTRNGNFVDISKLSKGVYFIRIEDKVKKLVIQ